MTATIAASQNELDRVNSLLSKNVPSYRQAYSDRTAWIMACLSELAYIKFNPLFSSNEQKKWFLDRVSKLVDDNKESSLKKLIDIVGYDHEEERKKLECELKTIKLQLVKTFDSDGTQAILVESGKFIALAFRGTEPTSMKDIRADAKAKIVRCEKGGRIHAGFKKAFEKVAIDIQQKLNEDEFREKPLFITGHSLGGALATIASKKLSHNGGIAACYTFGSPRVGDDEWVANIKTPIYRLVNAADCVTMLPPSWMIIEPLCWLIKHIPYIGESVRSWLSQYGGYIHCGNMRYLTNCKGGPYDEVKLLYSVSSFQRLYRAKGLVTKVASWFPWKKLVADHSITIYRKKLMVVAEKRNITKQA